MYCGLGLSCMMTENVDFTRVLRYGARYWIFWWFNWLNAWFYWVWWILSWCIDEATKASIENTDQFLSFLYPHITNKNYNFYKLKNLANPWFYWVFHKIWLLKYLCLYKPCQEDMGTHQTDWHEHLQLNIASCGYGYNTVFQSRTN